MPCSPTRTRHCRITKISNDAVFAWARILGALPRSRLLMKDSAFDAPVLREEVMQRFAGHGIAADRIDFLGASTREQHLAAFADTDIGLDPFPQNGGVSTWEALHMGVPVVAKLGNTAPSRLSGAILTSIGMDDWVTSTVDDYAARAVRFAGMPDRLAALRRELPARIAARPSGNGAL